MSPLVVTTEAPLIRVKRLLDIGSHELCDYVGQEKTTCAEEPGLDILDWCDNCRITEAIRILREEAMA